TRSPVWTRRRVRPLHGSAGFSIHRHRVSRIRRRQMGVRVVLAEGESIGQALKRFRKLRERLGATWEMRRRQYFVKPSQARRAKRFRKRFKARLATFLAQKVGRQPASSPSQLWREFWKRTGKP